MNRLIREICEINGNYIFFNHYGYNEYCEVKGWLELNNIQYNPVDVTIDPSTFQPIFTGIILHDENDLVLFLLRWS